MMIKRFKHKGLKQFFEKGLTKGLPTDHVRKIGGILDLIDRSNNIADFQMLYQWFGLQSVYDVWELKQS